MRVAKDEAERAALWRGRKSAFGAYGRSASGFYIMDGVVPRTRLAEALTNIYRICRERGLEAGNVFHAGDGNLHPHVLFDADDRERRRSAPSRPRTRSCACAFAWAARSPGEHGIGIEKRSMMSELFASEDLAVMGRLRDALNPERRLNPCKILPGAAGCGEGVHAAMAGGPRPPAQLGGMKPEHGTEGPWI